MRHAARTCHALGDAADGQLARRDDEPMLAFDPAGFGCCAILAAFSNPWPFLMDHGDIHRVHKVRALPGGPKRDRLPWTSPLAGRGVCIVASDVSDSM